MLRILPAFLLVLGMALPAAAAPDEEALRLTRAGASAYERGDLAEAQASFEAALARAPADRNAHRNLALALARRAEAALRRKDAAEAVALLDRALEHHPGRLLYERLRTQALLQAGRGSDALRAAQALSRRSPAYADGWLVLADVEERAGNLPAALEALERVAALRPEDDALRRRIAGLTTRADAEARYLTHGTGNFVVKYDPDVDPRLVQLALTLLEDAYTRVTADLGIAPRTPAQVVLYPGAEFQRVTGAHSWVGALYQNGVLRVPVRNLARHRATAARVLAHEFTHHVLKERAPTLPIWWHEGIAQIVERQGEAAALRVRELHEMLHAQKERSRLLTLDELQRTTIARVRDASTVQLFYAQAHAFVAWLVEVHGAGALPSFLADLDRGRDVETAVRGAFGASTDTLYGRWADTL